MLLKASAIILIIHKLWEEGRWAIFHLSYKNITEAVWDHQQREKGEQKSTEELWQVLQYIKYMDIHYAFAHQEPSQQNCFSVNISLVWGGTVV